MLLASDTFVLVAPSVRAGRFLPSRRPRKDEASGGPNVVRRIVRTTDALAAVGDYAKLTGTSAWRGRGSAEFYFSEQTWKMKNFK